MRAIYLKGILFLLTIFASFYTLATGNTDLGSKLISSIEQAQKQPTSDIDVFEGIPTPTDIVLKWAETSVKTNPDSAYNKIGSAVASSNLSLYPNPATGNIVTVKLGDENTTGAILKIADHNGNEVHREILKAGTNETDLLLQSLRIRKGMYTLTIMQGNKTDSQKLIVQ